jgi:hypothetical protein
MCKVPTNAKCEEERLITMGETVMDCGRECVYKVSMYSDALLVLPEVQDGGRRKRNCLRNRNACRADHTGLPSYVALRVFVDMILALVLLELLDGEMIYCNCLFVCVSFGL